MSILLIMIPLALFLGGLGLAAFLWSLESGQYDDLDGAAQRILLDDDLGRDESANEAIPSKPAESGQAARSPSIR